MPECAFLRFAFVTVAFLFFIFVIIYCAVKYPLHD